MGWFTSEGKGKNGASSNNSNQDNTESFSFSFNSERTEVMCRNDPEDDKMSICVEKTFTTVT